jgi:7,8-dihydropterin-6-yl-methyl-4-(beta-D-ribofuranosyl)aminobenzene 5'-phosphate synthase
MGMATRDREYRVTLLAENTARGRGILGEHGLAYWVETPGGPLLFDTGQGLVLEGNAAQLGIDLGEALAVVLSHGHYDHVGGLEGVLERLAGVPVYLHPDALMERYTGLPGGGTRPVNTEFMIAGLVGSGADLREHRGPVEVLPGVYMTGEVPRETDYEDTGGAFYLDAEGSRPDPIRDDQSLFFDTAEGVVLVLGCAHAGVVNTMRHVARLAGVSKLHAVIGGMHLLHAGEERLERTREVFRELEVAVISPCHCTGIHAVSGFCHGFPRQFMEGHAGKTYRFKA